MRLARLAVLVVVVAGFVLAAATPASAAGKVASCYADTTDGYLNRRAANGEVVRSTTIAVAHRTLPFGTVLMVKVAGRAPIRARVIDRGPYADPEHRVVDVTWGLARALGYDDCAAWGVRKVRTWRAK